jgi:hypothetical protein
MGRHAFRWMVYPSHVDDGQQVAMFRHPRSFAAPLERDAFAIGDAVRLTELCDNVASGAEGRVVGYYRNDPPRTLVAFAVGFCAVPDTGLELANGA